TQVTHDIHHLVIAEQAHHPAPGPARFALQRHQQVHDLSRLGAAIQDVPNLHQRGLTACPVVLLVYETDMLQDGDEVIKITVNISDGDQGLRRLYRSFLRFRPRQPDRQKYHEERNASAAEINPERADHLSASYSRALPDSNETIEFRRTCFIAMHLRLTKLIKSVVDHSSHRYGKPHMRPQSPGMALDPRRPQGKAGNDR